MSYSRNDAFLWLGRILAVSLAVGVGWVGRMAYHVHRYGIVSNELDDLISALEDVPPPGVDPYEWGVATGWLGNIYDNTCCHHTYLPYDALCQLRDELAAELAKGAADFRTIEWATCRFERTAPRCARYVSRCTALYVETQLPPDVDAFPDAASLLALLESPDPFDKRHAIRGLGYRRVEAAVPRLALLANDPDEDVRSMVAWALAYLAKPPVQRAPIKVNIIRRR